MFSTSRKTFPSFIRVELYISIFFFFFFNLKQHFLIHYRAFGSRQDSATEQRPQQSVRTAEDCRSKYVQYVCVRVCSGCVCVFFFLPKQQRDWQDEWIPVRRIIRTRPLPSISDGPNHTMTDISRPVDLLLVPLQQHRPGH